MITHVIRLQPNQDLVGEIKKFLGEKSIQAGYISMAVGSLSHLRVRFAAQTQYTERTESLEIISLSGSLSAQGCHIHGAFSDASGAVVGGHITEGCRVRTTAEIIVTELADWEFRRLPDPQTGYLELSAHFKGESHGHS